MRATTPHRGPASAAGTAGAERFRDRRTWLAAASSAADVGCAPFFYERALVLPMHAPLLYLRAPEREYAVDWEVVDERHDERYEGPREDAVVTLQRVWL